VTHLAARLGALEQAAQQVRRLGLGGEADDALETVRRARERVGFPGDAYVLALAGGTGVGKSSVLNALAGRTVSAVRAVRPTTDEPMAWVADDRREELAPLLGWLGVRHVAGHADAALSRIAILDLPDVDSVRTEHRALVDQLLPRIDAVAWVVDPEKYDDERLHAYLRTLRHHAERLRFVLNKADRVGADDLPVLEQDLARRLEGSGIPAARIDVVSAANGTGINRLRDALAAEADAKALVTAKLTADARSAAERLGAAVAVGAGEPAEALVPEERVAMTIRAAVDGALGVVDPPGLARQVQAAVLWRARRSGGSLPGRVVGLLGWMSGQQRRRADPAGYLRDWRRRGSLGRVLNPVRSVLVEAAARVPARSRPDVLRALGADDLESAVTRALDGVARDASRHLHVPGSWLWPVVGVLQLLAGAAFLFAVAWYVTLFLAGGVTPVTTVEFPVLGPLPLPLALLAGSVLVSAILGWLLSLHAGWIGRRRGRRVAEEVRVAIGSAIEEVGLRGLRQVEETRRVLAEGLGAMT
jgi:GTP-binding protein EngB required for normal cell division